MKYLKLTQYVYLVAAVLFAYKSIEIWNTDTQQAYLYIGITAVAVFMFFFRRKYAKKFEDRNKS